MTKIQFILALNEKLTNLPKKEAEERINFYVEMIDDRIEEGASEEEAVEAIGNIDEIASQIISDTPLAKIAKEKFKPKRQLKTWEIVLLILGSPVWLSLMIALIAVIFSLYVVLWSVIISLWAVFVALVACTIYTIIAGPIIAIAEKTLGGIALVGAGIACSGLSIFAFYGCKAATKAMIVLTKKLTLSIKKMFMKKSDVEEDVQ